MIKGSEEEVNSAERTQTSYKRKPENWARNKRKRLRNEGKEYCNTKGNLVEGKVFNFPRFHACNMHCSEVSDNDARDIFDKFWA